MKATHYGECQLCGREQKLPKGLLSNHGYSVMWNMFAGICLGSKELPYEQSCELIKSKIPNIEKEIKTLEQRKADLLKPATSTKCWYEVFSQRIYRTVEGELIIEPVEGFNGKKWLQIYFVTEIDGKTIKKEISSVHKNLLDVATELNIETANGELSKNIARLQKYLEWCNERILKWEIKELKPVG